MAGLLARTRATTKEMIHRQRRSAGGRPIPVLCHTRHISLRRASTSLGRSQYPLLRIAARPLSRTTSPFARPTGLPHLFRRTLRDMTWSLGACFFPLPLHASVCVREAVEGCVLCGGLKEVYLAGSRYPNGSISTMVTRVCAGSSRAYSPCCAQVARSCSSRSRGNRTRRPAGWTRYVYLFPCPMYPLSFSLKKLKESAKSLTIRPADFAALLTDIGFRPARHFGFVGEGGAQLLFLPCLLRLS